VQELHLLSVHLLCTVFDEALADNLVGAAS
jgi:hypothetical protein